MHSLPRRCSDYTGAGVRTLGARHGGCATVLVYPFPRQPGPPALTLEWELKPAEACYFRNASSAAPCLSRSVSRAPLRVNDRASPSSLR
jgi:hypothetical protein